MTNTDPTTDEAPETPYKAVAAAATAAIAALVIALGDGDGFTMPGELFEILGAAAAGYAGVWVAPRNRRKNARRP